MSFNTFLIKLMQINNFLHLRLESSNTQSTGTRKDFDNLVVLINSAGKSLCDKIMLGKEQLINDVIDLRNKVFDMKDLPTFTTRFEQLWSDASNMLPEHSFNIKSINFLETCELYSVGEHKGILEFVYIIYRMFQKTHFKTSIIL